MKAAVCYEFGKPLVIEDIRIDPPQAGEVKVKLAACAICHSDIAYMDGDWGGDLPQVFGHEAAGIVEAVGPHVKHTKPGDHVIVTLIRSCGHCYTCESGEPYLCATAFPLDLESRLHNQVGQSLRAGLRTGGFAEYVVVDESQLVTISKAIPLDSASLLACGVITGLGAVINTARIPALSSVAIIGCGGVGLNSVQGAHIAGAYPIVAIDLVNSKLEAAKAFGATHTVNPKDENAKATIHSLTKGRGLEYAFVAAGSSKAIEQGLEILGKAGTLVLVGMPPTGDQPAIEASDVANVSQRILGSKMGSARLRVDIPKLVELYQLGRLKLDELITSRYPLADINAAIDAVKQDKALRNVIVF